MKKMLILVMVIGVASIANAGLQLSITDLDGGDILPGDSLSVELCATTADNVVGYTIGLLTDNGAGGAFTSIDVSDTFSGQQVNNMFGVNSYTAGDIASIADAATEPMTSLFIAQYTAPTEAGTYDMSIVKDFVLGGDVIIEGTHSAPDAAFTVVPEPMTMALLGLGGLFLRRRK